MKYNIDELAEYLRISKWMIYKLVKHSRLPVQRIGSRLIFDHEEVEKWLKHYQTYTRM